jgi:MSHA biogenesis protein MshO
MKLARGFTLIELIVVVVLLGIMATGAGLLISRPIEAYNDQLRRQQLVDSAETALRKIAHDIRRAVPNSLRVSTSGGNWALEMVNAVDGARYRDEYDPSVYDPLNPPTHHVLEFSSADDAFNILGKFPNFAEWSSNQANLRLVIYSANQVTLTGDLEIYADAFGAGNVGMMSAAGVTVTDSPDIAGEHRVDLTVAHQFEYQSPGQRLFVVDGPVSYLCDGTSRQLNRYAGYGFSTTQRTTEAQFPSVARATVATDIAACEIDYDPGTATRSGLITLALTVRDAAGEEVRLLHQVHVDNVP